METRTHSRVPPRDFRSPVSEMLMGFFSSMCRGAAAPGYEGFLVWDSRSHSTLGGCDMVRARPAVSEPESRANGQKRAERYFRRDGPKHACFGENDDDARGRPTRHSRARATPRSDPNMRSARLSSPSIVLAALALALACVPAEATVRVRPVESTVVLEGVVVRDFRSRALQLDFCRAFTGVIGLDARVRPPRSARVSRARPSHPPLTPRAVPRKPRPPPTKNTRIDTPLGRSETTGSRTPRHPP